MKVIKFIMMGLKWIKSFVDFIRERDFIFVWFVFIWFLYLSLSN